MRAATEADVAAVAVVHVDSSRVAYEGVFPDAAIVGDLDRHREAWGRYVREPASPEHRLLVATAAGEIVGFAAFGASRDERAVGKVYAM